MAPPCAEEGEEALLRLRSELDGAKRHLKHLRRHQQKIETSNVALDHRIAAMREDIRNYQAEFAVLERMLQRHPQWLATGMFREG